MRRWKDSSVYEMLPQNPSFTILQEVWACKPCTKETREVALQGSLTNEAGLHKGPGQRKTLSKTEKLEVKEQRKVVCPTVSTHIQMAHTKTKHRKILNSSFSIYITF